MARSGSRPRGGGCRRCFSGFDRLHQGQSGKLTAVNLAPGSFAHLSFECYLRTFGGKAETAPYRTEAPALQDLWGGRVDLHLSPIISAPQALAEGKARAVAITTLQRYPLLPDVPTMDEQGVKGFDFYGYGVVAPKHAPQEAINRLNREIVAIAASPSYQARIIKLGATPGLLASPEQFRKVYLDEQARFGPLIKSMGIVIE